MEPIVTKDFSETVRDYVGKIFKIKLRAADMWSGVQKYDNCRVILYVGIDKFGRIVTGLTSEDESRLEKALGFDAGYLAKSSKFWKEFSVQIDSTGLTLDPTDPYQELQYLFLNKSNKVSKSLKAIPNSAIAVMYCEEEVAKHSNLSRKGKVDAFKKFATMSHDDMKKILVMYGKRAVDSMANDVVEDILGTEIELNPNKFLEIATDPNIEKKLFITGLMNKGIIKKIGTRYVYGEVVLGTSLESVVTFLSDKANQPILLALKELK